MSALPPRGTVKVVGISIHRGFKTKADRDFDKFADAIDKARDPKQINFLKMGRTDEEYQKELARLRLHSAGDDDE